MKLRNLLVVALSLSMLGIGGGPSAAQSEETFTVKYKAWVSMEKDAIAKDGTIDPSKVYVNFKPDYSLKAVTMSATLVTLDKDGKEAGVVGVFNCHPGDVVKDIGAIYRGTSCDRAPSTMIVVPPDAKLQANTSVLFTVQTPPQKGTIWSSGH